MPYCRVIQCSSAAVVSLVIAPICQAGDSWSFAVHGDMQWQANLDGRNPDTCAVGIIKQLKDQCVAAGVKFVVQVGDLFALGGAILAGKFVRSRRVQR